MAEDMRAIRRRAQVICGICYNQITPVKLKTPAAISDWDRETGHTRRISFNCCGWSWLKTQRGNLKRYPLPEPYTPRPGLADIPPHPLPPGVAPLPNPEPIIQAAADVRTSRVDIARLYARALHAPQAPDWPTINQAIIARWSQFALRWIRCSAWRGHCWQCAEKQEAAQ